MWTDAYDAVMSSISDLETLHEFYQSGEVDEDELADEYSKSLEKLENLEFKKMLSSKEDQEPFPLTRKIFVDFFIRKKKSCKG